MGLKVARAAVTSGLMVPRHPLLIVVFGRWIRHRTVMTNRLILASQLFPVQFCMFLSKHRLVLITGFRDIFVFLCYQYSKDVSVS